jgi:beta-barrel assembly-enhancing protease
MYRAIFAVSLLALTAGIAASALAYPGDDEMGPPGYDRPYPPGHDQYPPRGGFPPEYDRYGGTFGSREGAYPHAARPPAPNFMPNASAPDTAGSIEAARRLYAVADTVAIAGAPLCEGRLKPHTGMRTWSRDSMGPQAPQSTSRERADYSVTVFTIARNGPAQRAGLRAGDKITSINGESIPSMAGAMSIYSAKIEAALAARGPILLGYTREGTRAIARLEPVKACDYRVVFSNSPMINAATDGQSVTVMRGLVNFLSRDEELALVVGHELGHNVLGHFQRGRQLGHQAGPFNAGAQASMRQFEREADYIGLYFVALAGYDMNSAIQSSQKMASQGPMGDRGSPTHPSQAERYQILQSALREIQGKRAQGQALKPNLPTGRAAATVGERSYRGEVDSRLPIQ